MADFQSRFDAAADQTGDPQDYLKQAQAFARQGLFPATETRAVPGGQGGPPPQKTQLSPQSTGNLGGPPPFPAEPALQDIPKAPHQEFIDPMQVFKDPAILLAGLGSLFTRRPLTTAMNSAAEAMNGFQKGQHDVFEQKHQEWQDQTKAAIEQNGIELEKYKMAWDLREKNIKDSFAKLYAQAAGNEDPIMKAAVQSGNTEMIEKIIAGREAAQVKLSGMIDALKIKEQYAASQNDPDTIDVLARRANAGDTTVFQNVGRGAQGAEMIKAIRRRQTELAMEDGSTPQQAADRTTANVAEFKGTQAGERTLGTRTANIEMAVNEAYNMLPQAAQLSDRVPRTKWVALNKAIQAGETQASDPDLARFLAAHNAVINTYARAISPSGVPTVADKEHAREIFSVATGPEAYKAVLDQIRLELEAARKSPGQVREEFRSSIGSGGGTVPAKPKTPAEAHALPPGTHYLTPDGQEMVR